MSNRPAIRDVEHWHTESESSGVKVESGDARWPDGNYWTASVWRVSVEGARPKYFYGESAWNNAERYAGDQRWISGRTFS